MLFQRVHALKFVIDFVVKVLSGAWLIKFGDSRVWHFSTLVHRINMFISVNWKDCVVNSVIPNNGIFYNEFTFKQQLRNLILTASTVSRNTFSLRIHKTPFFPSEKILIFILSRSTTKSLYMYTTGT